MTDRLTKFNEETGEYEFRERAKTQEEFNAQRKAVIQRLGELEDMADRLVANIEVIMCKSKLEALDHRYDRVKADTVSEIRARVAVHFGTYCEKDQVKISDVLKLIDQIAKEMLEGDNEN